MGLYLKLYYEFFKIGLFTVGGGLATIPFLSNLGEHTNWFTQKDLINMIAISQSTPGGMGINMATYTGYLTGGIGGGVIATLGLVSPSIIVILLISSILKKFKENIFVNSAFYGLRAASTGLIIAATFGIFKVTFFHMKGFNIKALLLGGFFLLLLKKVKIHPIALIFVSGIAGVLFKI